MHATHAAPPGWHHSEGFIRYADPYHVPTPGIHVSLPSWPQSLLLLQYKTQWPALDLGTRSSGRLHDLATSQRGSQLHDLGSRCGHFHDLAQARCESLVMRRLTTRVLSMVLLRCGEIEFIMCPRGHWCVSGDDGRAAVDVSCATPGTWPIPAQEVDLVGIRQIHPRRGIYDDQLIAS